MGRGQRADVPVELIAEDPDGIHIGPFKAAGSLPDATSREVLTSNI